MVTQTSSSETPPRAARHRGSRCAPCLFARFGRCRVFCRRKIAAIANGSATKSSSASRAVGDDAADQRPADWPTAMTAPKRPMYRPRSRGLMMSAMMTWLSAVRPPAPRPWTTRKAMRVGVLREPAEVANDEEHERELDEQLAVEEVGELAPDRGRDRRGEQGRGDDPGEGSLVAVEVGDDPGERSRRPSARGSRRTCRAEGPTGPRGPAWVMPARALCGSE